MSERQDSFTKANVLLQKKPCHLLKNSKKGNCETFAKMHIFTDETVAFDQDITRYFTPTIMCTEETTAFTQKY
jgi:hypothetical protein